MSPPPPPGQDAASALRAQDRRSTSGSSSPRLATTGDGPKGPKSGVGAVNTGKQNALPGVNVNVKVHYTLLIRLPFARGDFEDPPQVEWDASKDRKLWKIISKNSRSADIDWAHHAQEFNVTQPFLLQQAAWLYERHFQNVKAQMTKLRTTNASIPPQTGTTSLQTAAPAVGGIPMKRLGSGGGGGGGASRAPSSLSTRSRESPVPRGEVLPGASATRPELSRTPSAATMTQSRHFLPPSSPRPAVQRSFRDNISIRPRKTEPVPVSHADEFVPSPVASPSASSTSDSDDEDDDEPPIRQSQLFRRPPPLQRQKERRLSNVNDEDEDSDDAPTFLPFAAKAGAPPSRQDPSATLKDTRQAATPPRTRAHPSTLVAAQVQSSRPGTAKTPTSKGKQPLDSSASSNSSTAPPSATSAATPNDLSAAAQHHRLNALSPRHRAELAKLSPRRTASGGPPGSDGTPSMGSSFSDLDDTSITQSALEEALASNLRHGGASRLSTISHAFGSRLYGKGTGG